jgi:hypothetical protein
MNQELYPPDPRSYPNPTPRPPLRDPEVAEGFLKKFEKTSTSTKKMDPVAKIDDANAPSPTEPVVALNANAVNAAHDGEIPIPLSSPLGPAPMPGPASEPSSEPDHESMASSVASEGEITITDQVI